MDRLNNFRNTGIPIPYTDPLFPEINRRAAQTKRQLLELNATADNDAARKILSEITNQEIDSSTTIFTPFLINLGIFTKIGKGVFINFGCTFLDIGGINIEDDVLIGPNVKIVSEEHPHAPNQRKDLIVKTVTIRRNAWIGAGAVILPGVTVGENSIVGAGSIVKHDVPANTIVAGVPSKIRRWL